MRISVCWRCSNTKAKPNFIAAAFSCNSTIALYWTSHQCKPLVCSVLTNCLQKDGPVEGEAKKDEGSRSSMELNVIVGIIFMVAGRPSSESIYDFDLLRTRLSSRPGSPPHPPLPSPVSKIDRRHTERLRKRDSLPMERGKGVGEELNITMARKPGPL